MITNYPNIKGTLGLKTLGFFVSRKGKMKQVDLKKRMREIKFVTEHSLTPNQREKLIQDKLERARLNLEARRRVMNKHQA